MGLQSCGRDEVNHEMTADIRTHIVSLAAICASVESGKAYYYENLYQNPS